jgi:pyruvate/2-oxoglutarate dehydrogenase complex dihydrolipoamide acyltransferase (E2) component
MPLIPIIMPQLGESIAEATIVAIPIRVGHKVEADQDVIEVETNKATMSVTSPCAGILTEMVAEIQQSYLVGAVLAYMEVTDEEAIRTGLDTVSKTPQFQENSPVEADPSSNSAVKTQAPKRPGVQPTVRGLPVPAYAQGASYMSPRMKARMAELGLHAADLSGIAGSGAAGRVTIEDFEKFILEIESKKTTPASSMRVAVADAMRRSWSRPIATVSLPINLDMLLAHRKASNPKPGPALYALRALGIALGENSAPGGRLIGDRIVHPASIDIGFAVEAEDGVLVPVMQYVDKTSLRDLVPRYNALIEMARLRRLPPTATGASMATVTNFGTFGLTWATPIPLPEQTLVLGMGAGRIAPNWDEAQQKFVPIMEANLTLSFDHRVIDGGAAGRLLQRVAALMMAPEQL